MKEPNLTYERLYQFIVLQKIYEGETAKGRFTGSIIHAIAEAMQLSERSVRKFKKIIETYPESELKNITNINAAYQQAYSLNKAQSEREAGEETNASFELSNNDKVEDKMPQTAASDTDAIATGEHHERNTDNAAGGITVPRIRLEGLIDANAKDDEVIDLICSALRVVDYIKKAQTILAITHEHPIEE